METHKAGFTHGPQCLFSFVSLVEWFLPHCASWSFPPHSLVAISFVSFMALFFVFVCQRLFRRMRRHNLTSAGSEDVCNTQNAMKSLLWVRDGQNNKLNEAHQTPRIGLTAAARNPQPVRRAVANYFCGATWPTWTHQTRTPARKLSFAGAKPSVAQRQFPAMKT